MPSEKVIVDRKSVGRRKRKKTSASGKRAISDSKAAFKKEKK